jgi:hypothetical protein
MMIVAHLEEGPGKPAERRYAKRVQPVDSRGSHRETVDGNLLVGMVTEET